jgi:hypothetical protein
MMTTAFKSLTRLAMVFILSFVSATASFAQDAEKLAAEIKQLKPFSTDPQVVSAVKAYNSTTPSPEAKAMTNEKWRSLTLFDPFVRAVGKNALSAYLKTKQDDMIAKVFVSGADGGKVGFDAKTEHWTHKGMPKHEVPMSGKMWTGPLKLDDSTGLQMIQVGLPVLDGGKPIGSIVFGLRADKLR